MKPSFVEIFNNWELFLTEEILSQWQDILDLLVRITGVKIGLIMRVVDQEIEVFLANNTPNNPYNIGDRESWCNSGLYCEYVIKTQEKLLVKNALNSPQWCNNPDLKYNLISYLGFPLRLNNDQIFGTICLLHDQEWEYTPEYIALMEKMRDLIERDLTIQINNWHNEEKFRLVFEKANTGMCLVDLSGNLIKVNETMTTIFGYSKSELETMTVNDLALPIDEKISNQYINQAIANNQDNFIFQKRYIHRNGQIIYGQVSSSLVRDHKGNPLYFISQVMDISDRKKAEENLRISEKRNELIADYAVDNIWTMSLDYQFTYVSPSITNIRGYTPEEVFTQSFEEILTPNSLILVYNYFQQIESNLQKGLALENFREELEMYHKNGSTIWTEVIASPIFDRQGKVIEFLGVTRDISDRKNKELELKQLQEELVKILDNLPLGIAGYNLEEDPEITFINKQFQEILGYTKKDLCKVSHWWNLAYPDPIYRQQVTEEWLKIVDITKPNQGEVKSLQVKVRNKQGQSLDVLFNAIVLEDRVLVTMVDLTKFKKIESELEAARLTLAQTALSITEAIPVGTYTMVLPPHSSMAYFSFMSEKFLELTGLEREEAAADPLKAFACLHPEDYDGWVEKNATVFAKKESFFGETRVIVNGEIRWITAESIPRDLPDGSTVWEGVLIDITDRKNAEEKLKQANEKIIKANQELEVRVAERTAELEALNQELLKATRLKDEFLATMSHELRTPLNAILGLTESLQEEILGPLNGRQVGSLRIINKSGKHLLNLINDILDLSKIEARQMELDLAPTSISSLCQGSLIFVKQQAFKKQISLETKLPPNLPNFNLDERRIMQALINLLNNAVKFTEKGGRVTLEVIFEVKPKTSSEMNILRFIVKDTGIGIALENIPKLFQPFRQLDSALNRKYEGTGLGLALVKRLVELHGGTVGVNSEIGVGSCFTIELPVDRRGAVSPPAVSPPKGSRARRPRPYSPPPNTIDAVYPPAVSPSPNTIDAVYPPKNPLILLVEDNKANIMTIENYLEAKGYRLIITENGEEALKMVKSKEPDLVLMDISSPKINGINVIKNLKQDPNFFTIPIIALTALEEESKGEHCLAVEADQYLTKPVKLKELIRQIKNLLSLR